MTSTAFCELSFNLEACAHWQLSVDLIARIDTLSLYTACQN